MRLWRGSCPAVRLFISRWQHERNVITSFAGRRLRPSNCIGSTSAQTPQLIAPTDERTSQRVDPEDLVLAVRYECFTASIVDLRDEYSRLAKNHLARTPRRGYKKAHPSLGPTRSYRTPGSCNARQRGFFWMMSSWALANFSTRSSSALVKVALLVATIASLKFASSVHHHCIGNPVPPVASLGGAAGPHNEAH
jgi:hypothetical protein